MIGLHEHREPWWNNIDRGKPPIRPPKLSGNPASSHLVAKQEELAKEIINFALQSISVICGISGYHGDEHEDDRQSSWK
jgi:hypothetical protein